MEIGLAFAASAAVSAYVASVREGTNPHPLDLLRDGLRKAIHGDPDAAAKAALKGMPAELAVSAGSIDASRCRLSEEQVVRLLRVASSRELERARAAASTAAAAAASTDATEAETSRTDRSDGGSSAQLRTLDLSNQTLNFEAATALTDALEACHGLFALQLRGCGLGDANATMVCAGLRGGAVVRSARASNRGGGTEVTPQSPWRLTEGCISSSHLPLPTVTYRYLPKAASPRLTGSARPHLTATSTAIDRRVSAQRAAAGASPCTRLSSPSSRCLPTHSAQSGRTQSR